MSNNVTAVTTAIPVQDEIDRNVQITLFVIVGCISFLCNSLIFLVIGFNRKLHTKTNCLLISLALTDWLIIVVGIPFHVVNLLNNGPINHDTYCNTTGFLILVPFLVSNFNMALIAMHRYILIVKNKYYKSYFSFRNISFAVVTIWLIGIIASLPPFFGWGLYRYDANRSQCMIFWKASLSYLLFVQIIAFPVPLIVMAFSYYNVLSHIYASRKRLRASTDRHNFSKQTRELSLTFMLLIILCIFFVLFLPYAILIYLEGVFKIVPSHTFSFVSILLAYSNSMFDFWIYAAMSTKFRKALIEIFRRCLRGRTNSKIYPSETSSGDPVNEDFDSESSTPQLSSRRRSAMNSKLQNIKISSFYKTDEVKNEYDEVSDVYIGRKPTKKVFCIPNNQKDAD